MPAAARKITVEIPADLLSKAQKASGTGITQTIRAGLELIAAGRAYDGSCNSRARSNSPVRWTDTLLDSDKLNLVR